MLKEMLNELLKLIVEMQKQGSNFFQNTDI